MMGSLQSLFARYPALRACEEDLAASLRTLIETFSAGNKLLTCGNGGSAADCEHIVGELMKGFVLPRRLPSAETARLTNSSPELGPAIAAQLQGALPAISLVSHSSLNSAVSNDTSAEMVFAQQVYGLGKPGDTLLAITTSGNSRNVINALVVAKAFRLKTLVLSGRSGGAAAPLVDVAVRVPADCVVEIQELHLPVYHWLCTTTEEHFFSDGS